MPIPTANLMLEKPKRRIRGEEQGFTLIELLVVILIIGILAAIALPSFLNQRAKAQDAEAKANARTAQTTIETYYADNQTYNGATAAVLRQIEPALNEAKWGSPECSADGTAVATGGTAYCVVMQSKSSAGSRFWVLMNWPGYPAGIYRLCQPAGVNGCKSGGTW